MHARLLIVYLPLLAMLVWASAIDVRSRRIPNWLTLAVAVAGLAQAWLAPHLLGVTIGTAGTGLAVGLFVPFVFFAINALGAGDVKLLAAIGAWVGPWPVLGIMLASAVAGGIVALVQGLMQRRLGLLLGNTALLAMNLASVRRFGTAKLQAMGAEPPTLKNTIPYAVPILMATTGFVLVRAYGWM